MRKTKIICTLGPATEKSETIRQLIARGADVFRLNMSHAPHEWVREIVPRIRKLADQANRPVGILLDTQGPAIRTGPVKTPLDLKKGDVLEFTVRHARKTQKKWNMSARLWSVEPITMMAQSCFWKFLLFFVPSRSWLR